MGQFRSELMSAWNRGYASLVARGFSRAESIAILAYEVQLFLLTHAFRLPGRR